MPASVLRGVSACPLSVEEAHVPPAPDALTYSLTLPAGPASARIARVVTRAMLHAHGLDGMADA